MTTWCFKAAANRTRATAAPKWYWQIDPNHTLIAITSIRLFSSLEECIANARENGFRGEVEIPAVLNDASVITCEEGGYLHAVAARASQTRANRQAA